MVKTKIAVLVSGGGTNLQALLDAQREGVLTDGEIVLVISSNDSAYALTRAAQAGVPAVVCSRKALGSQAAFEAAISQALSDHGVIFDDSLAVSGENTFATGYQGLISLMSQPSPPTAIFSTNYDITVGLITAARERGVKIPDEVSVFGFDCAEICRMMTPPIPVVQQPEQELGRLAGMRLIERMSGSRDPARITRLPCRLIE